MNARKRRERVRISTGNSRERLSNLVGDQLRSPYDDAAFQRHWATVAADLTIRPVSFTTGKNQTSTTKFSQCAKHGIADELTRSCYEVDQWHSRTHHFHPSGMVIWMESCGLCAGPKHARQPHRHAYFGHTSKFELDGVDGQCWCRELQSRILPRRIVHPRIASHGHADKL